MQAFPKRPIVVVWIALVFALTGTASAQNFGPLHPVPFLEPTDLFWSLHGTLNPFRIGTQNLLEADIFPHFIVGVPSHCRRDETENEKSEEQPAASRSVRWPCVSVTPAVRLRMARNRSAPINSPSFAPRLNVQWLFYEDDVNTHGLTLQAGHHSNGQSGCLFSWTDRFQENERRCADSELLEPHDLYSKPQRVEVNTIDGNFSMNYFAFTYDFGTYDRSALPLFGQRFGELPARVFVGLEWIPPGLMYEPMRELYPHWLVRLGAAFAVANVPFCKRFDIALDTYVMTAGEVQGTCILSEERGLGMFVRGYVGRDEYNSSYFGNSKGRIEMGVTINRLRVFGSDY